MLASGIDKLGLWGTLPPTHINTAQWQFSPISTGDGVTALTMIALVSLQLLMEMFSEAKSAHALGNGSMLSSKAGNATDSSMTSAQLPQAILEAYHIEKGLKKVLKKFGSTPFRHLKKHP